MHIRAPVRLRESVIVAATILFAFAGKADVSPSKPSPQTIVSTNALPSQITTTDGTVYHAVKLIRIEPDGLLVHYQPASGGIGLANLKFAKLPEPLQKQFGYNPAKAAAFEQDQARAAAALSQKLRQEDKTSATVLDEFSERPNLSGTVSVSSSDPTVSYSYYPPGQKPLEVGEYTGVTIPHFTCRADFTFNAQQGASGQPVHLSIATVTISLGLSCHITEPEHPYEFVSRHEEGHRKICEYFYRFGPQVAQRIGEAMIGRQFAASATDVDAAETEILPMAQRMVESQYTLRLYQPAIEANRYYDQLNDPEGKHIDVDKAVQDAIAKYVNQINLPTQIPANLPSTFGNSVARPQMTAE